MTADGAVPIAHRVADGNTNDDSTHIDTWNGLVALTGRTGFLYVADCKLATRDNMAHIDRHGGRFVSVLPATRKEDKAFRDWIVDHEPDWTQAARRPGRRQSAIPTTSGTPCPRPGPRPRATASSGSAPRPRSSATRQARTDRIARGIAALDDLNQRLASPKTRMKTVVATEAGRRRGARPDRRRPLDPLHRRSTTAERFRQEKRGRPGNDTRYRRSPAPTTASRFTVDETQIARDAASDGCFPLISNDPDHDRRRAAGRLQVPAQPGEAPRPAQGHPTGRAGVPARPRPASKPCCAATSSPC